MSFRIPLSGIFPFAVTFLAVTAALAMGAAPAWRAFDIQEYKAVTDVCTRGDTVWMATDGGVYRSLDNGAQWSGPGQGMGTERVTGLACSETRLVATQYQSIFVSEDRGQTWVLRDSLVSGGFIRLLASEDTLFAYRSLYLTPPSDWARISLDHGLTWQTSASTEKPVAPPPPVVFHGDTLSVAGKTLVRKQGATLATILTLQDEIVQLTASAQSLFVRTSGGFCQVFPHGSETWSPVKLGYRKAKPQYFAVDSLHMAMQTDKAIYLSANNGTDWDFLALNFHAASRQRLTLSGGRLFVWMAGYKRIHSYDIAEARWDSIPTPAWPNAGAFAAGDGLAAVAMTNSGGSLLLFTDQGNHFLPSDSLSTGRSNVSAMAIASSHIYVMMNWGFTVYSLGDRTWKSSPTMMITPSSMAVTESGVYMCDVNGSLWRNTGSSDSWENLPAPLTRDYYPILAGWGNKLYYLNVSGGGAWVREQPGASVSLRSASGQKAVAPAVTAYPVRAWVRPGAEESRDALGKRMEK